MSRSTDPGHFFQTTSALEEGARKASKSKNTKGDPIKLPSKILAVTADPEDPKNVYVAEAAGTVKQINLETHKILTTYSGPAAPLPSLGLSPSASTVFAGCWDKSIWSWSASNQAPTPGKRFQGHADFVKVVIVVLINGKQVLVSGSSDASIIVWDVESGKRLHTLKGHTRGILALAVDPLEEDKDTVIVWSAGSDREIRRWRVGLETAKEIQSTDDLPSPLIAHETSVDALLFDSDGDLWTASADKTVKCLSRSQNFSPDTSLEHPDFVRDVVVDEEGGWVVTACRDEEVRVFDKSTGKLHHVFSGHFEEVTGLVLLPGQKVVSVSIDGTVRQWSLKATDLKKAIQEAEDEMLGKEKEEPKKDNVMTAEEEAELADLLEESE